jgi:dihydrofolate synthase
VGCHCGEAIRFPLARVDFFGVDPPGMHDGSNEVAWNGVAEAVQQWREDPHGKGEVLAGKRRKRNPWGVSQLLFASETDRRRSGVQSELLNGGKEERLLDASPQPWNMQGE